MFCVLCVSHADGLMWCVLWSDGQVFYCDGCVLCVLLCVFSVVFVSCWFGLIAVIECCEACSVVWFVISCELLVVCVVVVCV